MDLTNSRLYSDILPSGMLHSEPYNMTEVIQTARDSYGKKPPVMIFNPYASELDHLDKTIFLERRMRIQENIINKHKVEAERSLVRGKDGSKRDKVLTKNLSMNDLSETKKSYSGIFSKQRHQIQKEVHSEDVWLPGDKETQGIYLPQPPPTETLDTARGKAKYALVRLNSTGHMDAPTMYLESVPPMINPNTIKPVNSRNTQTVQKKHSIDPNKFIGSESRAVLEKVNGATDEIDAYLNNVEDTAKNNSENYEYSIRSLTKKVSKITLDDLKVSENADNPLMSRKSKLTTTSKAANDGKGHQETKLGRRDRRPSRDTNQSYSRKSSITNSRQSSQSWSKNSNLESPMSIRTVDSISGSISPTIRRTRSKKPTTLNNSVNSNSTIVADDIPKTDRSVVGKKKDFRQNNSSQNNVPITDVQQAKIKSKKNKQDDRLTPDNNGIYKDNHITEGKVINKKSIKNVPFGEKMKEQISKEPRPSENSNLTNKIDTYESNKPSYKVPASNNVKSTIASTNLKPTKQNKDQKSTYAGKNKGGLRKTDSFKMMGNSSQFFGYCSVPEEEKVKKPKSILKKTVRNPERPDTA